MIEGTATRITFAREVSLQGGSGTIDTTPGKIQFAASQQVRTRASRLDEFRHLKEVENIHSFFNIELAGELDFNLFSFVFLGMLFNEYETENIAPLFARDTFYLRGNSPTASSVFWIQLEDGTSWKLSGAVITSFDLVVTARQIVTFNASLVALDMVAADFVDADRFHEHAPLGGDLCQIFSTHLSTWPEPENIGEVAILSYAAKFNFSFTYDPAQFGIEGRASRYRKGATRVTGAISCESPLRESLLIEGRAMKHMLQIRHGRSDQRLRFYFDSTFSMVREQPMIMQGKIASLVEFESVSNPVSGLARMELIRFRDDPPDLLPFDFAVVRYIWTEDGGTDMDTRTAIIESGDEEIDGIDVGWSRNVSVPFGIEEGDPTDGYFLVWGADNTGFGNEAVLIDFKAISEAYPSLEEIKIRLRSFWYSTRNTGDFTLEFTTYLGGSMSQEGYDFVNLGGELVQQITVPRNTLLNDQADLDGDEAGLLLFDVESQTANIIEP